MDARHSPEDSDEQPANDSDGSTYYSLYDRFWGTSSAVKTPPQLIINTELYNPQEELPQANISPEDLAREDARESKPRVIKVLNHTKSKLNICVLGCQGEKKTVYAKQVAAHINEIAGKSPELKPDLFIILGDNFYPDGVPSPTDPRFETHMHEIFGNPELKHIKDIPCIVLLGNHDLGISLETWAKSSIPGHNYIRWLKTNPVQNEEAGLQQIAHSLSEHPSDPVQLSKPKAEFFKQESVNYDELPKHLMPHYFHSWIFDQLQIFALNSNTYVKDYLNFLRDYAFDTPIDPTTNQAAWAQKEYLEAKLHNRATMFTQHHPLFSLGKRVYEAGWDANHYLDPLEITLMNRILQLSPDAINFKESLCDIFSATYTSLDTNANYNEMLTKIMYTFQKMSPDMVCAAHDHTNYYYNNKDDTAPGPKICEVIAGGGGSKDLQDRYYFGQHENLGGFIRNHGFSIISCDKTNPQVFDINMFASSDKTSDKYFDKNMFMTNERHLHFTSQSSTPLRMPDGYDLALMSDLPEQDKEKAKKNIIYLSTDGKYVVRDIKENVSEGQLDTQSIDLSDLKNKLKDPQLKCLILEATSKAGHTLSDIRVIVLAACDKYQLFLNKKQLEKNGCFFDSFPNPKLIYKNLFNLGGLYNTLTNCTPGPAHTHGDVDIMHDMMNYLNQPNPSSYEDTINFLHICMSKLYNKEYDNSLYMDINEKLQKAFEGKSIGQLFDEAFPKVTIPEAFQF